MKGKLLKVAASILLTGLLFYYFYQTIDGKEVGEAIKGVRWSWMAAAALAYCVTYPVRAFRIYYLTKQLGKHTYLQTLQITFRHQFYARIIPFKVGDLSLVYLLKSRANVSLGEGGAVLLMVRVFDAVMILLSFLLCNLFVNINALPTWSLILLLGVIIGAVFSAPAFLSKLPGLLHKMPGGQKPLMKQINSGLLQVRDVLIQVVARPGNLLVAGATSLVMWFFVYWSMHGVMLAFSQQISFFQTVVASFLASAAAFLPINGIGGFGMVETGWTLGFSLLGVARTVALSSGVVSNAMSFLLICFFGLLSYIPLKGRKQNV